MHFYCITDQGERERERGREGQRGGGRGRGREGERERDGELKKYCLGLDQTLTSSAITGLTGSQDRM